jgi:tRNA nucleotidyltransferase (CCA-adding enzyme)
VAEDRVRIPGRCYAVGGCVRDELLGRPVSDRDWVVVGATPQAMVEAGFRPVGRDFPVFLHPHTGEEYALARTERKSAPGYHGFSFHAAPDVTLEQDLARRDLTINAMAREAAPAADGAPLGRLIDPFGGERDLRARVLRHVSPAFAEDPVRLLRVARFAARFDGFTVAPETRALLRRLVDDGEVDALVPERVWQEIARGLMERHPRRMLAVLHDCGALPHLLPGVPADERRLRMLDHAAGVDAPLPVRFGLLVHGAPAAAAALKAPAECQALGALLEREATAIDRATAVDAAARLALIERCDAIRRPERFAQLLLARECEASVDAGRAPTPSPRALLLGALERALAVDTAAVAAAAAARGLQGPDVGAAVRAARLQAVAAARG